MQYLFHPHHLECDKAKCNHGNPTDVPASFFAVEIHLLDICIGLALTVLIRISLETTPTNLVIVFLGYLGNMAVVRKPEVIKDNTAQV